MSKSTYDRIEDILVEQLMVSPDQINENTAIIEDLGADSLDLIEFVIALESEFGFEIPDEDAERFTTVGDVVKYVQQREDT